MSNKLFEPVKIGALDLKNRIVMASMTRCRADNEGMVPTTRMIEYYRRRASAGLIISEGSWVSKESMGFINVPGIYTAEQVEGWKPITAAVHAAGGKIFSQLGHLGAVSHPDYFDGDLPVGPSAVNVNETAFSPNAGFTGTVVPREMTVADIKRTVEDYKTASVNAKAAGFDGVEIHGAYLYLIPEFLNSATNLRTDEYGGSPKNRSRFVLEIVEAVIDVWGPDRVAFKLSPGVRSGLVSANADTVETYTYLVKKLNEYPLAFLHGWGFPGAEAGSHAEPFNDLAAWLRPLYKGTLIVSGSYTKETGEAALEAGKLDAVAYATPFVANPDLVDRFRNDQPLAEPNRESFYAGGEDGYNDYQEYQAVAV